MSLFSLISNPLRNLSDLKKGETATIRGFSDERLSLKLMDMGCLPGTQIELLGRAPLGDPLLILVGSSSLAIRNQEACSILLEPR